MESVETSGADLVDALRTVAINSAYNASRALSKWFKCGVRVTSDGFESLPIRELADVAGDPDEPVAAIHLSIKGDITETFSSCFPRRSPCPWWMC